MLTRERGATALILVLGASAVLLLIAVTISGQARQGLRMSTAEADAAAVQATIKGAVNEAIILAESDVAWPTTPAGNDFCTPTGSSFPRRCIDALPRRTAYSRLQIPIRVVWQVSPDVAPQAMYAWLILTSAPGGTYRVSDVKYYYQWCTPPSNSSLGPCEQGG